MLSMTPENDALSPARQRVSVRERFGLDTDLMVDAFAEPSPLVPAIDPHYHFDPSVTLALLAGFQHNRRVLVQGLHGTGKSTHIEQVAARLNWPCMRVNLDGHISRLDLVGKDAIGIEDGKQVTTFQEGILPWALRRPMALLFDEYDAGRPDVMFVIQRLLERDGQFTLLEQNAVIDPHPHFRLFATANTVGQGNTTGLYHGVQRLNHAQLDRWNLVARLDYLPADVEVSIVRTHMSAQNKGSSMQGKGASMQGKDSPVQGRDTPASAPGKAAGNAWNEASGNVPGAARDDDPRLQLARQMVAVATLTRQGFASGDISTLMSPRTVLTWTENLAFFPDPAEAFRYSFLNKVEQEEQPVVAEYYQRCFDVELAPSFMHDPMAAELPA